MAKKIGNVLKEARIKAGISIEQISKVLTEKGYKASIKTIYSWENCNSNPGPDALLEMCDIYKIDNILSTFGYNGYNEDGSLQLNLSEIEMIEKYRFISKNLPGGAETIDMILESQHTIAKKIIEQQDQIKRMETKIATGSMPTRIISYCQRLASAGSGEYLFEDVPTDVIKVKDTPEARKADFVIGVNGHSMEPDYLDGEKVFVKKTPDIGIGEVGVFVRGNECFIKECGQSGLISRNENYPGVEPFSEGIKIVGKIVGKATELD